MIVDDDKRQTYKEKKNHETLQKYHKTRIMHSIKFFRRIFL